MLKTRSGIDVECNLIQQALKTFPKHGINVLFPSIYVSDVGTRANVGKPSEIGPCLGAVGDTRNWIPGGIRVPINSWLGNRRSTEYHFTSGYRSYKWLLCQK